MSGDNPYRYVVIGEDTDGLPMTYSAFKYKKYAQAEIKSLPGSHIADMRNLTVEDVIDIRTSQAIDALDELTELGHDADERVFTELAYNLGEASREFKIHTAGTKELAFSR